MARNSEKAMTTLARWRAAQMGLNRERERRPYLSSECEDLPKAEKWRRQIIGEISRKVAQIQNAGLGEFKLRDLNDEINKLLREKGHWEDRIKELGGPDYKRVGPKMLDHEGKEVPGNRGYKYFGAAKELPGVRELFEQEPPSQPQKTRADLMKDIDAEYYGYRDDDDGVLIPLEQEQERIAIAGKIEEWKQNKEAILRGNISEDTKQKNGQEEEEEGEEEEEEDGNIYAIHEASDSDTEIESSGTNKDNPHFIAHVPVPSQQEIEEALVQRKKLELLEKYASVSLQEEETEVKQMLGM